MKKALKISAFVLWLMFAYLASSVQADFPPLAVRESDGTPNIKGVREIRVSNGSLTNIGGGVVSISTSGGGGGSLTVQELDGSPSVSDVDTLTFDQADGFVVSNPSGTEARIDLAAVPYARLALTGAILNADLAGSIAASKLVGTDIATVGTITAGTWSATTIAISKGGTGQTTASAAFNALSPMTTSGDIIYGGASGAGTRLGKGTDGQVLTLASGLPSWADAAGGGGGLTIGTTTITSGANTKVLFNNSGVVGEYTITGTGNAVMSASPTLTGTINAAALTMSGNLLVSGTASRFGTATTNDTAADTMFSASGTTKKALVVQAKASPTASPFVVQMSDGTPAFQVQSDGGVIIDQQTQAVFASIFDVKFQGAHVFQIGPASAVLTGDFVFGANANMLSFAGSAAVARNATGILEINNSTAGQWGALKVGTNDSGTNTITSGLILGHQSTGTPAAGLGIQALFNLNSTTTPDRNAASIAALWTTATDASRTADMSFSLVNNAGALAEVARFTGPGNFLVNSGYIELSEITAPANAAANKGRLYLEDNGGGKTRLVVIFPSGAAQVIATEP